MWFYAPTVETLPRTCDSFKLNLHRRSEQDDERMETERQEWKGCGRGRERDDTVGRMWDGFICGGTFINVMSQYKKQYILKTEELPD